METHDLIQGSQEWHAYRATHNNASDAPVMMGVSPYKTRDELLHERYTGLQVDVDAGTQARFNDGHRFEELYRPLAEKIIGRDLYPVTGSLGDEGASFDGLTLCQSVAFEHKTLSDRIRAATCAADLPIDLRIQMEQQLHICEGEKVLFGASKWDASGNLLEDVTHWYAPDLELRARILAGWRQFEVDLAAYVPPHSVVKAVAEPIMALPALIVQTRGEVVKSNLPEFELAATEFIAKIKTDLVTDDDFANAEATVKFCQCAEEDLEHTKAAVLGQAATIDSVMKTIDNISAQLRAKRLALGKLVDRRKLEIKESILAEAKLAFATHLTALEVEIKPIRLAVGQPDFAGAMKNKRTLASLNDAVNTLLANSKITANELAADCRAKLAWCKENATDYGFLFMDMQTIIGKAMDDFQLLVTTRIDAHKKTEADKVEALRAKIAEEERVKAEAAAAETARLAKVEADRIANEAAESEHARIAADNKAAAVELKEAQANPDGAELSPAAQVLNEAEGAQRFVTRHRTLAPVAAPTSPPTLRLGQIADRLGFALTADFLRTLGFEPAAKDKAAVLYHEAQFPYICQALVNHITKAQQMQAA